MPFVISNGNFATLRFLFTQKYFVFLREPYYVTLSFIYRYTMAVFLIPSFSTAIPIRINGILFLYSIFYSVVFVAFRLATPQTLFVLLRLQSSEADYSYFQSIFDYYNLYSNSNISLNFYYSEGYEQTDAIYRLINIYGKSLSNKEQGKNLIHKLLLENRLNIIKIS